MKIHLIGIGGIGVSALAQHYLAQGHQVSGSDLVRTEITDLVEKRGAKIEIGQHRAKNILSGIDLVIYSPAVPKDNPELKQAKRLGVKCLSYPEALGELTKEYFSIAVSGTHGKSTTSAMIGLIMLKAGLDPTVIIGTKLQEFGESNFKAGKSKYLVIEADEWQASFLNYWPKIIVLTNIEEEHLDYYRDLNHILATYKKYIEHLPEKETLVVNGDDKNIQNIISNFPSFAKASAGRQFPRLRQSFGGQAISKFQFSKQKEEVAKLKKILQVPGKHNIENALAALMVARSLGISDEVSFKALGEYQGSWRRFEEKEFKIKNLKFKIISDYGHHPTEIKATLKAAQEKFPEKKIWCVFQPHQYQRTYYLFDKFIKVFKETSIDKVILTDIYDVAGRETEKIKKEVSTKEMVKKIAREKVIYLPTDEIIGYLKKDLQGGEVVIIMGAGNIYELVNQLIDIL